MKFGCSIKKLFTAVFLCFLLFSFSGLIGQNITLEAGQWTGLYIPVTSLHDNKLGDPEGQVLSVYLPSSYNDNKNSNVRYPVIYFLGGYTAPIDYYTYRLFTPSKIQDKKLKDMIIVIPNGVNTLGGAFYHNSIVTGKWEDFIVRDVVGYIDSHLRTIAKPESRGISGVSMGGYGSIEIALKHPEVFSVLFSLSPGLFAGDDSGLREAMSLWKTASQFYKAYGAAFSPNTNLAYPYAEIPQFDGSPEDNRIVSNWINGFGNFGTKLDEYLKKPVKLKNIRIEWGTEDEYTWIPKGCVYFSQLLSNKNIPYSAESFAGGHDNRTGDRFIDSALPYFSENLSN